MHSSIARFAIISIAIVSTCLGVLGQGTVTFGNDANHLFVLGPVTYTVDGTGPIPRSPLPSGLTLTAVLYAGTSAGSLSLQKSVVLSGTDWLGPGRMANKHVILTNVPGGATAYFQIIVTDTGAVLPAKIGAGEDDFPGRTYKGTSDLFTAIPGSSLTYPSLATSASASTWASGPLPITMCYLCFPEPPYFQLQPSNTSVVAGSSVTLSALARSTAGDLVRYQWWKDGSPVANATNSAVTLANTTLSDAGVYNVVARNIFGSAPSHSASLTVFLPAIAATLGSPTYTANNQFQFTVTGAAGSNYVVQVATSLSAPTAWISLLTNASPFTFVETNAQNFPQRFYRAYAP